MTRVPEYATPGTGQFGEHVAYWYSGDAVWYTPSLTRPTASTEHRESCTHRHPDYTKARTCGDQLGRRRAIEANAKARTAYSGVPCDLKVWTETDVYDGQPGYILYCAAHHTNAPIYRRSETEAHADTSTWTCQWDGWEMPS